MRNRRGRAVLAAASAMAMLGAASPLLATNRTYIGPDGGDWNTSSYWSPTGVPKQGENALFQPVGIGSYTYDGTEVGLDSVTLGDGVTSTPTLNVSSGELSATTMLLNSGAIAATGGTLSAGAFYVGNYAGASAEIDEMGGGMSSQYTYVGASGGSGAIFQTGTSTNSSLFEGFDIGDGTGSNGTVSLGGGTLSAGYTNVGYLGGSGSFLESGSLSVGSLGTLGIGSNSFGFCSLNNGSLKAFESYIGYSGGAGTFAQSGSLSVANFGDSVVIGGGGAGASGTVSLTGGSMSAFVTAVGASGDSSGTFDQTGSICASNLGTLIVGNGTSATGFVSLGGGSLSAYQTYVGSTDIFANGAGAGTFVQTAGSSDLANGGGGSSQNAFDLGDGTGSTGVALLYGGSLTSAVTYIGFDQGTGTFSQSGTLSRSSLGSLNIGSFAFGTVSQSGGSLSASETDIGENGIGAFTQSGGSSNLATGSNSLIVGFGNGAVGTVSLMGGSLTAAITNIGYDDGVQGGGSGTYLQSGGSSNLGSSLYLGEGYSASGTVLLSGGTLTATNIFVGYNGGSTIGPGGGTFVQSAGRVNVNALYFGDGTGSTGAGSVGGGSMSANNTFVGFGGGAGTLQQSAGSTSLGGVIVGFLYVGDGTSSIGCVSLTGGSMSTAGANVGYNGGVGIFIQNGGFSNLSSANTKLNIGSGAGSTGTFELMAGTLNSAAAYIGITSGAGTFIQSGGVAKLFGSSLFIGNGAGSSGMFSLTGGSLSAGATFVGTSSGSAAFLQSGSLSAVGLSALTVGATSTIALSGGTLNVNSIASAGTVIVNGGTLAITGAGSDGTGSLTSLAISNSGVVDVGSSGLVLTYSGATPIGELVPNGHTQNYPAGSVQAWLQSAYDGGAWDGPGLSSSAAENDPFGLTAVGALDQNDLINLEGSDYTGGTWMGVSITSDNTVLVRYTYYGDTDLNGTVDSNDVNNLELGYAGFGDGWVYGDFNYDGVVDSQDVNLLDLNYGNIPLGDVGMLTAAQVAWLLATEKGLTQQQIAAFEAKVGLAVPEPVSIGLLAIGAVGLMGRRRR